MEQEKRAGFYSALSLIIISISWHFPGRHLCALLSWIGCLLLCRYLPSAKRPYKSLFAGGAALHCIGFYWLFFTIRDFGGFNNLSAAAVFSFFVLASSLQFVLLVFIWRNLRRYLDAACLSIPLAWFCAENLSVRIFPWMLGHSQLSFTFLAQAAEIGGAAILSFLMLWTAAALADRQGKNRKLLRLTPPLAVLICACLFGYIRMGNLQIEDFPTQKVALIQANISLEEKHNVKLPMVNAKRYAELSESLSPGDKLIVWPETVITEFISTRLRHVADEPLKRLPFLEGSSLLLGSLTYESRDRYFNSAIGIEEDGTIAGIYHKQILMPFGEYTPFAGVLPWLRDVNATAGDFSAGEEPEIITFRQAPAPLRVAALICYEDVVPLLSRAATANGANLLVNLTNDAWFGNTIAPYQHHLIASFRAIENRRYLLRSTNTGLTAIVNPFGQTIATLPPYSEGVLEDSVSLISSRPLSQAINFPLIYTVISWISLLLSLISFWAAKKSI